ncbi:MAG: hypothetical protein HGA21_00555 [Burkholderiaceae bacterium]|nr:hypothetical protein [Burkholderiaceae bacterium]
MRQLILALMIILLPLRGWMGDVMAMDAAMETQVAIHSFADGGQPAPGSVPSAASSGPVSLAGGPVHCPDHASAPDKGTNPDGDAAAHGQACTVCQVCHTVAISADAVLLAALPLPVLAPATSFHRFTSALPAPGLKPPIS